MSGRSEKTGAVPGVRGWSLAVALALIMGASAPAGAAPAIQISSVPAYGQDGNATGVVSGVNTSSHWVALLIYVPGANWWTKPTCEGLNIPIATDGSWSAAVVTGGADATATRFAAFLIPKTYTQTCTKGSAEIPSQLRSAALAEHILDRTPAGREITFSGRQWSVKASSGTVGPGPNYFSDSSSNVWVDALGRLHLKITSDGGQWRCAEVILKENLGYGSYRFRLASDPAVIDAQAVFGLFTWSDHPDYNYREIDIEFSRWGVSSDPLNAQFVVQPHDTPGNRHRFTAPAGSSQSVHAFNWRPSMVSFLSAAGHAWPVTAGVWERWTYTGADIPVKGDENVRLNLWLFEGRPPAGGQPVEVVIQSFEFVPWAVSIRNSALSALAFGGAPERPFRVWGRVSEASDSSFVLDDGSGAPLAVSAPGHPLQNNAYGVACVVVDSGVLPPEFEAIPGSIQSF